MVRSKKAKVLKYKTRYVLKAFPFKTTSDISEAKNFYPFAHITAIIIYQYYKLFNMKISCRVISTLSVTANFDSKMEVETGGIKGAWQKFLLSMIRILEEQRKK